MKTNQIIDSGKEIVLKEADALKQLATNLDDNFVNAVKAISNCKGKVILAGVGKSGHIAQKIAATFSSIGIPSLFLHPTEASHGDMGVISAEDVILVLSNGGESQELYDLLDYGNRHHNVIIAIVGKKNSTLYERARIRILIPSLNEGTAIKAPMVSTTLMLACGDAIAASLIKQNDISNDEFKKYHPGGKIGATLLTVADIMRKGASVPVVHDDQAMTEALAEITEKSLGCTGVISKYNKFVGVITDGDLRRHMNTDIASLKVHEVMNVNPKTVSKDYLVVDALRLMNKMKITSLFIVSNDGQLEGIVHVHDCIKMGIKSVGIEE